MKSPIIKLIGGVIVMTLGSLLGNADIINIGIGLALVPPTDSVADSILSKFGIGK